MQGLAVPERRVEGRQSKTFVCEANRIADFKSCRYMQRDGVQHTTLLARSGAGKIGLIWGWLIRSPQHPQRTDRVPAVQPSGVLSAASEATNPGKIRRRFNGQPSGGKAARSNLGGEGSRESKRSVGMGISGISSPHCSVGLDSIPSQRR